MVARVALAFGCFIGYHAVSAQSASDSVFTIQTSPPEPSSSSATASVLTSSVTSSVSASASATSASQFPQICQDECSVISNVLGTCASDGQLNTTCLCTVEIERNYTSCVQCALELNPDPNSLTSYQALIDAYIEQCASAPNNPISLPNVTVTLPSGSAASTSRSANVTSSALSTSVSSTSTLMSILSAGGASQGSAVASSAAASVSASGSARSTISHGQIPGAVILAALLGIVGGALLI